MAGLELKLEVQGMEELQRKMEKEAMLGNPLRILLGKAALIVERGAKERAPVDTGRLRASITTEVSRAPVPMWAKIGSNVQYASFVEYGTRPHFPPPGALARWAQLHGIPSGFLVARAIAKRGTKGRSFLKGALEEAKDRVDGLLREAGEIIKRQWEK